MECRRVIIDECDTVVKRYRFMRYGEVEVYKNGERIDL